MILKYEMEERQLDKQILKWKHDTNKRNKLMLFMQDKLVIQVKREIIKSPTKKKRTRSKFSNKRMKNVIKK